MLHPGILVALTLATLAAGCAGPGLTPPASSPALPATAVSARDAAPARAPTAPAGSAKRATEEEHAIYRVVMPLYADGTAKRFVVFDRTSALIPGDVASHAAAAATFLGDIATVASAAGVAAEVLQAFDAANHHPVRLNADRFGLALPVAVVQAG
ncbi:MAG: hypothetical protein HY744_34440 [Deltaproteobacteria bacterium]|nr:hypothetical protein [Deltaproteobacteria bacterium]